MKCRNFALTNWQKMKYSNSVFRIASNMIIFDMVAVLIPCAELFRKLKSITYSLSNGQEVFSLSFALEQELNNTRWCNNYVHQL